MEYSIYEIVKPIPGFIYGPGIKFMVLEGEYEGIVYASNSFNQYFSREKQLDGYVSSVFFDVFVEMGYMKVTSTLDGGYVKNACNHHIGETVCLDNYGTISTWTIKEELMIIYEDDEYRFLYLGENFNEEGTYKVFDAKDII